MNSKPADEINRVLARTINDEARRNPASPYAGKYVGVTNGKVVAVADGLDEMLRQLRQVESDPQKTLWIEASADYNEVQEVWSCT